MGILGRLGFVLMQLVVGCADGVSFMRGGCMFTDLAFFWYGCYSVLDKF